jgi:hypothetical protein
MYRLLTLFEDKPSHQMEYIMYSEDKYGYHNGKVITPPKGWEIIPENEDIPQEHRYFSNDGFWCHERRCHSTMTPINARVWGFIQAFAKRSIL